LRFAILTATRSNEAIGATWDEINLGPGAGGAGDREWRIPADRMKMDKPFVVPLSDAALALLGEKGNGLVFRVDNTRTGMINQNGLLKHFRRYRSEATVHGFRATFATWAEDAQYPPNVIEAALAHEKGDSTVKAYRRSELLSARRELMAAWAAFTTTARTSQ
jgi:integrase